jgi:hypothetical protein
MFDELTACRFFFYRGICRNRDDKVQIGMDEFIVFDAGRANATRVAIGEPVLIAAIDKLGVSDGQSEFPATFASKKQLSMAYAVFAHRLYQSFLNFLLSDNIFKKHPANFVWCKDRF